MIRNEPNASRTHSIRSEEHNDDEAESDGSKRGRLEFNKQVQEAIHKVRMGADEIEECILDESTPFIHGIMATQIPSKFKIPTLDSYDGTGDPVAHVSMFRTKMMLQNVNDAIICWVFPTILMNTA